EAAHIGRCASHRRTDLGCQLRGHTLVGVDVQHPLLSRRIEGELLLRPIPRPGVVQHAVGEASGEGDGPVLRAAVDYHDLVAPGDALEAGDDRDFLVLADDRTRETRPVRGYVGGATAAVLTCGTVGDGLRPGPTLDPACRTAEIGAQEPGAVRRRRLAPE